MFYQVHQSANKARTIDHIPKSYRLCPNNPVNVDVVKDYAKKLNENLKNYEPNKPPTDLNVKHKKIQKAVSEEELKLEVKKIVEDKDFQLDLNHSGNEELQQLDGNLNTLMAIVRLTLSRVQHNHKTTEKSVLKEKEDKLRAKFEASKQISQSDARVSFAHCIATLATTALAFLPELSNAQDVISGIAKTMELGAGTLRTASSANLNELNNKINLSNQEIQKLSNKEPSAISRIDDSLARMLSDMRVN